MAKVSKAKILKAIPGSGGLVTLIAKRCKCEWHTAKNAINEYPEAKQLYEDEAEGVADVAESNVIKAIQNGDLEASRWYLSRKGRNRGYTDTQKLEHSGSIGIAKIEYVVPEKPKE